MDEKTSLTKELLSDSFSFLTRSLVKNNVVKQNLYVILMTLEYLSMLYYIIRLADGSTLNSAFKSIENFLDVSMSENNVQIVSTGGSTPETMTTTYIETKAMAHALVNLALLVLYTTFMILFIGSLLKIKSFD